MTADTVKVHRRTLRLLLLTQVLCCVLLQVMQLSCHV
jgi:hypothetical protein